MSMIFHEQPTKKWKPFDFLLLEAYQILQDETCPSCGHPIWLCRSTDRNVVVSVGKAKCFVTAELEKVQDKYASKKSKKDQLQGGEYLYANVKTIEKGTMLPSREDYYKSLIE